MIKRCDSITSVIIPEGVTELPEGLFLHCDSVVSIKVPSSVGKIEGRVFEECPRLTISVSTGSVAEKYAKDNVIPYVIK